jgi:hypothetical protein
VAEDVDPLRVAEEGKPYEPVPTPAAVVFDKGYQCIPPAGYQYDRQRDEVPYDQQGSIFTALPSATYAPGAPPETSYVPVVTEVPFVAPRLPCQQPKSKARLEELAGAPTAAPDGNYLAWLIIDPAAPVYPAGETSKTHTGVGVQRWGWFDRYLAAYIDGGAIPTEEVTVMEGDPPAPKKVRRMVTQKLYYPRSMVIPTVAAGKPPAMPVAGKRGAGYDVLAARRPDAGYSPVCEVLTYDAGAAPIAVEALPRTAATIETTFNTAAAPIRPAATPYIFCLQGEKP